MQTTAGIVLAGGRSTRMGRPKATLDWHGRTLLDHVVDVVGRGSGPVMVVGAPGQRLPALPSEVRVVRDARPGRGPVEGLLAGLSAAAEIAEIVFATAVDAPFLDPAFVRAVLVAAEGVEVAVPVIDGRAHPLAAAYRTELAPRLARLMEDGVSSLTGVIDACRARRLDRAALLADVSVAAADPDLRSL
ncbi:MAG: molybdenum cofactor guanylyltransferase, partial [Miltoncostaeaceae bacterium]